MKSFRNCPGRGRAWASAALAGAMVLVAATVAHAAMTKDQVARKIEKDFNVKVLRVEPMTEDGRAILAVTVMSGGGNWNHAFQVNTIAVDAATGEPVVQYGQRGGQLRKAAPPVQDRTAPMTAEDQ